MPQPEIYRLNVNLFKADQDNLTFLHRHTKLENTSEAVRFCLKEYRRNCYMLDELRALKKEQEKLADRFEFLVNLINTTLMEKE